MTGPGADPYVVLEAAFARSAPTLAACADGPTDLPEVAFVGRSNVGKSSLIGELVGRKKLVKTSKRPGHTRALNFFDIELRGPENETRRFRIVDLPGYGFAQISIKERMHLSALISGYLSTREPLVAVCHLLDLRHKPTKEDQDMIDAIGTCACAYLPVATKADKLAAAKRKPARKKLAAAIARPEQAVTLFSAPGHIGRGALWGHIWGTLL